MSPLTKASHLFYKNKTNESFETVNVKTSSLLLKLTLCSTFLNSSFFSGKCFILTPDFTRDGLKRGRWSRSRDHNSKTVWTAHPSLVLCWGTKWEVLSLPCFMRISKFGKFTKMYKHGKDYVGNPLNIYNVTLNGC